jgi:hypothetical protein
LDGLLYTKPTNRKIFKFKESNTLIVKSLL